MTTAEMMDERDAADARATAHRQAANDHEAESHAERRKAYRAEQEARCWELLAWLQEPDTDPRSQPYEAGRGGLELPY